MAERFRKDHKATLERLIDSAVLHVDETPVKIRKGKGYVWVFSNMEDVFFMYRPTREADFLKDILQGFSRVLISDRGTTTTQNMR